MRFYSFKDLSTTPDVILEGLSYSDEVVLTENGKPAAVLLNVSEDNLEETLRAVRQAKVMMAFNAMRLKAAEKGFMSDEEINAEIAAARSEQA